MISRWGRVVLAGAVTGAAAVGWAIYTLRVAEVRVVGAETLSANDVLSASGLHGGERILWTQMTAIMRRIERVPGVAEARVERSFPDTVVIHVDERRALATLDRRPALAADGEGVVFAYGGPRLPVLVGWRGKARPGARLDAASRVVLRGIASFPGELLRRTQRVDGGPTLEVTLDDGTEVRFGPPKDIGAKARAALAVLSSAVERKTQLAYIDVRAPSAPATRPRGAPTPAPSPAV